MLTTRTRRRSVLGRFATPVAALAVLSYFGFHAFSGQYGIRAHYLLEARLPVLQEELAVLRARARRLERRVAMLRDGSIERDMLDEQARSALTLARSDELILVGY